MARAGFKQKLSLLPMLRVGLKNGIDNPNEADEKEAPEARESGIVDMVFYLQLKINSVRVHGLREILRQHLQCRERIFDDATLPRFSLEGRRRTIREFRRRMPTRYRGFERKQNG